MEIRGGQKEGMLVPVILEATDNDGNQPDRVLLLTVTVDDFGE